MPSDTNLFTDINCFT